ncbi:GxxExxY protein [Patescibacteria group bacterium]|nr:GxxExxY protein [Desulfobacteraceae bacterium]MBU4000525.1 GxxExxY protein [Patescibacteria group bacterium]MBU4069108.1 GxxExxY protein [Pseudomonadota bacterium]MBU4126112.1 GxxExxY protein [Pseudomonadota bacterium]
MKYKELTHQIIDAAYQVHKVLGYGFLEKVYQNALMIELRKRGIRAESERPLKIQYESEIVGDYICDIVVEDKVILELKAVKEINDIHEVQLVNYLKGTGIEVGLLINFGPSVQVKRKVLDSV